MKLPEEHTISNINIAATIQITSVKEETSAIYKALLPEAGVESRRRASINLKHEDRCLTIEISAQDLSTLRALVGSYLRLVKAASTVIEKVK